MTELRTFKAQKGKSLYCPSGDIIFTDGFYTTKDEDEIACIERGVGIEEVTGTDEAKEKPAGKKRPVITKEDKEKNEKKAKEKKEKEEKAKEEKPEAPKEPAKEEKPAGENKKQEGDVELKDMTVEQLKQYLDTREVGYADDLAEDDLRNLALAEEKKEAEEANGGSDVEDLGEDEDVEVMPKPRCKELLDKAGVEYKNNAGVTDLRLLVEENLNKK